MHHFRVATAAAAAAAAATAAAAAEVSEGGVAGGGRDAPVAEGHGGIRLGGRLERAGDAGSRSVHGARCRDSRGMHPILTAAQDGVRCGKKTNVLVLGTRERASERASGRAPLVDIPGGKKKLETYPATRVIFSQGEWHALCASSGLAATTLFHSSRCSEALLVGLRRRYW